MTDAPERIWAKPGYDSWNAYGHWYEDATGGGTEYIRSDLARPMTVAEAAKLLLAENIEGSLAKSMAHFVSVKEWEGYKRGVQAYTERLRALSQGGE